MAKVVTLTPNPALDVATHVDRLVPEHKLRCGPVRRDPGGGGINVARVIHRLGGKAVAVFPAGGSTGDLLQGLLRAEGVDARAVKAAGATRESLHVSDAGGAQYRFVLPGEPLSESEWTACRDTALAETGEGDFLVGSGSLPPGVLADFYAGAFTAAKAKGAKTVIDTHGPPLDAALAQGVYLLKASAREMATHLGHRPADAASWCGACSGVVRGGKAEIVIVTLGAEGAVLIGAGQALHATVPVVKALTSVGAGDAFLGGFLFKLESGAAMDAALRYAAACGTAALLSHGTGLSDPAQVERLLAQVAITEL